MISCEENPFPGFSKTKSGIYYKLLSVGTSKEKVNYGDYVTADIVYQTIDDSIFFNARRKVKITYPEFQGSIDECFAMLYLEDSACFILNAGTFFSKTLHVPLPGFLKKDDLFKVSLKILDIKTEEEFLKEKEEFLTWIEDFSEYEQTLLKHYIEEEQINVNPSNTGLYHIIIKKGNDVKVHIGDTVIVNYEGRFLNGKIFDSTWKRNMPFEFVYGQEWQVIKGLEEAIGEMTELEESFFIMPSSIAFGETGSSTGLIPPFTSLIFKVQLLEVRPGKLTLDSLTLNQ
ncbi:MAG: hypothetical protein Kow0068_14050 [Marinilabiliales bacterium]